jgi:hypothetical protein
MMFCWFERKIVNNVSYNIRGSYIKKEIGRCIVMIIVKMVKRRLCLWNSFQVVYDDMKTVSFSGDLKANFSDDVTLESAEL